MSSLSNNGSTSASSNTKNDKKRKVNEPVSDTNSQKSNSSLTPTVSSSDTKQNVSSLAVESNKKLCTIDVSKKQNDFMGKDKFKIILPASLKEWLIDDYDLVMHQNKVSFIFLNLNR